MRQAESMHYLNTGQVTCHDISGRRVACQQSGQDPEFSAGVAWPIPRFMEAGQGLVSDRLTGLIWTRDANPAQFPLSWQEAFEYVAELNAGRFLGFEDWRLPNRRELRSLISHQTKKPALPEDHTFQNFFQGWYWSSTTAAISPSHAWYVHLEGGRMFYGHKQQSFLVWPLRGESKLLPATGQTECYDAAGSRIACLGSGQDGEQQKGIAWPKPRFDLPESGWVRDRLTGLLWRQDADLSREPLNWGQALAAARNTGHARLPTINELESLVDCSRHSPSLPEKHPFSQVREAYWSSTTSLFEPDWAWALYLNKGACGVGQKKDPHFYVWLVRD
jgi:hypothetical protein